MLTNNVKGVHKSIGEERSIFMVQDFSDTVWPGWNIAGILGHGSFGKVYAIGLVVCIAAAKLFGLL